MQRLALGLALAGLEALWFGAWLRWAAAMAAPGLRPLGLTGVIAVAGAAVVVTRALLAGRGDLRLLRALNVAAAALVLLAAARLTLYPAALYPWRSPDWIASFARDAVPGLGRSGSAVLLWITVAWLWWRGTRRASAGRVTPGQAWRSVGIAVAALAALAVLVDLTHPVDLAPWLVATFVTALVALALARLHDTSQTQGDGVADLARPWVAILAGSVVVALALTVGLSSVISLDAGARLADALAPLPKVLQRVAVLVLYLAADAVFTVVGAVIDWLAPYLDWDQQARLLAAARRRLGLDEVPVQADATGAAAPPWLVATARLAIGLAVAWITARWLARALRRRVVGEAISPAGVRESRLTARRVLDDTAELLKAAVGALGATVAPWRRRRHGVRGLYAALLDLMADRGRGRDPAATPYEFAPVPKAELPAAASEAEALTEAYVRVRYGEHDLTPAAVSRLASDLRRIQAAAAPGSRARRCE